VYFHQAGSGHRGPEHGKEFSSAVGLPPATAYAQCVRGEETFGTLGIEDERKDSARASGHLRPDL
jgi:hypothetical protein